MGLKPKNKGHANFYECCDLTKKVYLKVCSTSYFLIIIRIHVSQCVAGDGGNDVSMIQAASAGIGLVGKEGKQASLAADVIIY